MKIFHAFPRSRAPFWLLQTPKLIAAARSRSCDRHWRPNSLKCVFYKPQQQIIKHPAAASIDQKRFALRSVP